MKRMGLIAVACVVAACAKGSDRVDTTAATSDTAGMAGMRMPGGMASGAMMDSMTAHMRSMDTTSAAAIQAMMPMHRQMAEKVVAQMDSEMRSMNMQDARWSALMDSVRQDLARMPNTSAQQTKAFMTAHQGRMTRLMQSHKDMMKM